MQKQLKAISHKLRSLWPGTWQIRSRLLTAGLILSLLSLSAPLYMRSKLTALASTYDWSLMNRHTLDRIHEFQSLLTDSESKLRAFATSGDQQWLASIVPNGKSMEEILIELKKVSEGHPRRVALLREASDAYHQWRTEIALYQPNGKSPVNLEALAKTLISEPLGFRVHSLLNEVAKDIHDNDVVANLALLSASEHALIVVTYVGIFFFIGFVSLILSLWYTLIPGLDALLNAAKEFKRGNLDHRIAMSGRTETAKLARAFNEMAVSVKAQNEKLKELNRLKSDFVSTVSHELRTPLTAIKGSIGLILGNVTGPIADETAQMLKITQKNTDRLIRLINEVLDVAKIEAGAIQMKFDKYSLVDTVGHAVLGIEAFAQTQGIQLVWEKSVPSPLVVIDRDRIEQVITNLLSNAIKFTEPGGTVTVRCEWEPESDGVVVHVSDTGQGIPEEFLERIFDKFQQAERSTNKAKEGTGLGLTIARAIVEEHGGSIWVRSKVGAGTTFSFALPWNGTEYAESKKSAPTKIARNAMNRKILIVDNEPDFITVCERMLDHEGYEILSTHSGQLAIELATSEQPDLIILDVMMPEMDGFTVQKILADSPETKNIPIVFATVTPDMAGEISRTGKNVVHVIPKPIVPEDFKLWLKNFFNGRAKSKAA